MLRPLFISETIIQEPQTESASRSMRATGVIKINSFSFAIITVKFFFFACFFSYHCFQCLVSKEFDTISLFLFLLQYVLSSSNKLDIVKWFCARFLCSLLLEYDGTSFQSLILCTLFLSDVRAGVTRNALTTPVFQDRALLPGHTQLPYRRCSVFLNYPQKKRTGSYLLPMGICPDIQMERCFTAETYKSLMLKISPESQQFTHFRSPTYNAVLSLHHEVRNFLPSRAIRPLSLLR